MIQSLAAPKIPSPKVGRGKKGIIPFFIALPICLFLDLLDFLVIGFTPIAGDIIDAAGSIVIALSGNPLAVIFTAPEYVDLLTATVPIIFPAELFPSFTIALLIQKALP